MSWLRRLACKLFHGGWTLDSHADSLDVLCLSCSRLLVRLPPWPRPSARIEVDGARLAACVSEGNARGEGRRV